MGDGKQSNSSRPVNAQNRPKSVKMAPVGQIVNALFQVPPALPGPSRAPGGPWGPATSRGPPGTARKARFHFSLFVPERYRTSVRRQLRNLGCLIHGSTGKTHAFISKRTRSKIHKIRKPQVYIAAVPAGGHLRWVPRPLPDPAQGRPPPAHHLSPGVSGPPTEPAPPAHHATKGTVGRRANGTVPSPWPLPATLLFICFVFFSEQRIIASKALLISYGKPPPRRSVATLVSTPQPLRFIQTMPIILRCSHSSSAAGAPSGQPVSPSGSLSKKNSPCTSSAT